MYISTWQVVDTENHTVKTLFLIFLLCYSSQGLLWNQALRLLRQACVSSLRVQQMTLRRWLRIWNWAKFLVETRSETASYCFNFYTLYIFLATWKQKCVSLCAFKGKGCLPEHQLYNCCTATSPHFTVWPHCPAPVRRWCHEWVKWFFP